MRLHETENRHVQWRVFPRRGLWVTFSPGLRACGGEVNDLPHIPSGQPSVLGGSILGRVHVRSAFDV